MIEAIDLGLGRLLYLNSVNDNVGCYFKNKNIITRPNAGSGVWLSILLPCAVLYGALKFPESSLQYHRLGVFSLGLIITAIIFIIRISKYKKGSTEILNDVVFIAPAISTGFLLFRVCNSGIIFSIIASVFSVYPYCRGTLSLLTECPISFTFGEASVIVQSIVLFLFSTVTHLYDAWFSTPCECMNIATTILQVGLLGIGIICGAVYYVPTIRSTKLFYGLSSVILVGSVLPSLHILLQHSPILWIVLLLFADLQQIILVTYWILCSSVAVQAVTMQIKGQQKASTIVRKYFHILAVAVYIPGLIQDCCFLYLASGIVLALFIVLEMLRKLQMPPIGVHLQNAFFVFADEKDKGGLSMTPMYLFAGCSAPLWLHPIATSDQHLLTLLSGVLSIGVGDTAASVFGTWFGKHKWSSGTMKSIEGTVACILSQLSVVFVLMYVGYIDVNTTNCLKSIISIVITSVVEAKTDQVDNLALPLIMYILVL